MTEKYAVFWFRRDLRMNDNAALFQALKSGHIVLPIFIFDRNILDKLEDKTDRRVEFIHQCLTGLDLELQQMGSALMVFYGFPLEVFQNLTEQYQIGAVYANHDYEPYARQRDEEIEKLLATRGIGFHTSKDQCVFEKNEILSNSERPYTVFTPYSRKWKEKLNEFYLRPYPTEKYFNAFLKVGTEERQKIPPMECMGFQKTGLPFPGKALRKELLANYGKSRDFPGIEGTSRLSVHLRFGTVSIRELATRALEENSLQWLNELIWRDFYMMILYHFPNVSQEAFQPAYRRIEWRNHPEEFKAWCEGKTGYPIVDAGMRELNATGFMHNRVRMVTASFLVKHLLIDWRWGEAYFAGKLLDFDLSANNGGWQWAAGTGCDAAPYFRIFNPTAQSLKFDKEQVYIKKWIPELNQLTYAPPIVEHTFARKRVLEVYKKALEKNEN